MNEILLEFESTDEMFKKMKQKRIRLEDLENR